eukprot:3577292-Alexandrium_andersonii.AAC.1
MVALLCQLAERPPLQSLSAHRRFGRRARGGRGTDLRRRVAAHVERKKKTERAASWLRGLRGLRARQAG